MRFYHRLIRTLRLPQNARPEDAQIVIGPDLPPCMQSEYAAAVFFQPEGSNAGIDAPASRFIGIQKQAPGVGRSELHFGWTVYDGDSVCGYVVDHVHAAENDSGELTTYTHFGSNLYDGGTGITQFNQRTALGSTSADMATMVASTDVLGPWAFDGITAPRSRLAYAASQSDTGGIGTGFVNVLNTSAFAVNAGRALSVQFNGQMFFSAGTNTGEFYVNVDVQGVGEATYWQAGAFGPNPSAFATATHAETEFITTNSRTVTFKVYIRASAGTVNWRGNAAYPRSIRVMDIGAASDYSNAITLP